MKNHICLVAVAIVLFCAATAQAQPPDWSYKVQLGKHVFVTTDKGERVEGLAGQVTPEGILVATPAGVRTVSYRDMRKVEKRDALWTGAAIGGFTGFALGLAVIIADDGHCSSQACRSEEASVPVGGALYGALIGWGIDALVKGRTTIYDRERPVSVGVAPRRGGAVATITARW